MAESDISISEMTNGTFSAGAIFPAIQPDGQSSTGYSNVKLSGSDIGDGIGQLQFPLRLDTSNKTIFGAINEAANAYVNILPTDTATGSIASFPDGANGIPLQNLILSVEPTQSGSGDPSPSNVRPISGHAELNLVHTGKNLFSDKFSDYAQPVNYRIFPIKLENGKPYKLSATLTGTATSGCVVGIAKSGTQYSDFVGLAILVTTNGTINTINSFTADSTWTSPVLIVYANDETAFNSVFANYDIQFEQGSTATAYEPYTGSTTTTDLGTTVYGGTLNPVSGVLTIKMSTKKKFRDYYWGYNPTYRFFYCGISDIVSSGSGIVCDCYETVNSTTGLNDKQIKIREGGISLMDTSYTDTTSFLNAMGDNEFVYELATPTTTQLTPQEVKSLLGGNNFYHDCNGQVTVTYRADIGLYIAKKTA